LSLLRHPAHPVPLRPPHPVGSPSSAVHHPRPPSPDASNSRLEGARFFVRRAWSKSPMPSTSELEQTRQPGNAALSRFAMNIGVGRWTCASRSEIVRRPRGARGCRMGRRVLRHGLHVQVNGCGVHGRSTLTAAGCRAARRLTNLTIGRYASRDRIRRGPSRAGGKK
jgi:hypothetical protein